MYRPKEKQDCEMPESSDALQVLVLNASLKHEKDLSNTGEVAELVLSEMTKLSPLSSETIRLSDKNIPVGLAFR
ncbi:MAG: hypothetical protein JO026_03800, partial [Patescibacteria group bacterium]|nr:hypothetical protein [Patescibacteria group bacterium]